MQFLSDNVKWNTGLYKNRFVHGCLHLLIGYRSFSLAIEIFLQSNETHDPLIPDRSCQFHNPVLFAIVLWPTPWLQYTKPSFCIHAPAPVPASAAFKKRSVQLQELVYICNVCIHYRIIFMIRDFATRSDKYEQTANGHIFWHYAFPCTSPCGF